MLKKEQLSVLIPVYNDTCTTLVKQICEVALATEWLEYEVIVADDGSTDMSKVAANECINMLPGCRYVKRNVNVGRAAIRNFLASEARFEWLLFLDCDVVIISRTFIANYFKVAYNNMVICGGLAIGGDDAALKSNLRYIYEKAAEKRQTAACRNRMPCQSFRTTNFFINRGTMLDHPFNEGIKTYGYEDVLFGKELQDSGITVFHIDNQVEYTEYEDNAAYLKKTEEAMHTLHNLKSELESFSSLVATQTKVQALHLSGMMDVIFRIFEKHWRKCLLSQHPSVAVYNAYRLFYFNRLCRRLVTNLSSGENLV